MNEDKLQALIDKYPKLFKKVQYLECAEGWYPLLETLFGVIEWHIQYRVPSEVQDDIYIEQIKEKFATLRCYFSNTTPFIDGAIHMAESISGGICEYCSLPGKRRSGGWIKTLCDQCEDDRKKGKLQ